VTGGSGTGGDRLRVQELWVELGTSMRILRTAAGVSLRRAELMSGRGRGSLSQVENAKARPTRDLVEWYDDAFAGDGLLLSVYAEARGAHGGRSRQEQDLHVLEGDSMRVVRDALAHGERVPPGARLAASWTVHNDGAVPWTGRRLRRVGAAGAVRVITSPAFVSVPDCRPDEQVVVTVPVTVPDAAGTYAAYWTMVDPAGCTCFSGPTKFALLVTAF
jgi:transcriptional regulator with XRE-family HTH domain